MISNLFIILSGLLKLSRCSSIHKNIHAPQVNEKYSETEDVFSTIISPFIKDIDSASPKDLLIGRIKLLDSLAAECVQLELKYREKTKKYLKENELLKNSTMIASQKVEECISTVGNTLKNLEATKLHYMEITLDMKRDFINYLSALNSLEKIKKEKVDTSKGRNINMEIEQLEASYKALSNDKALKVSKVEQEIKMLEQLYKSNMRDLTMRKYNLAYISDKAAGLKGKLENINIKLLEAKNDLEVTVKNSESLRILLKEFKE